MRDSRKLADEPVECEGCGTLVDLACECGCCLDCCTCQEGDPDLDDELTDEE